MNETLDPISSNNAATILFSTTKTKRILSAKRNHSIEPHYFLCVCSYYREQLSLSSVHV